MTLRWTIAAILGAIAAAFLYVIDQQRFFNIASSMAGAAVIYFVIQDTVVRPLKAEIRALSAKIDTLIGRRGG